MIGDIKFSLIVPAYNVGKYIACTIDSVLKQSYESFELIIIDDGSTDDTLESARRACADDNRCLVFHTENKGVSAARNLGLNHCSGQYVYFLDGDDCLPVNALDSLAKTIGASRPDIVVTKMMEWDGVSCGPLIATPRFSESDLSKFGPVSCGYPTFLFLFAISQSLISGERFDEGLTVQEDSDFLLRVCSGATSYALCDSVTYCYRKGRAGSALSSLNYEGCLSIKEARKRILLSCDDNAPGYNADSEFAAACFGVLRRASRSRDYYYRECQLSTDLLSKLRNDGHFKTRMVRMAAAQPRLLRPVFMLLGLLP